MTYVELFTEIAREAYKRHGLKLDESRIPLANSIVPECHGEVPEDMIEIFREVGAIEADRILDRGPKAAEKELLKHITKN